MAALSFLSLDSSVSSARSPNRPPCWASLTFLVFRSLGASVEGSSAALVESPALVVLALVVLVVVPGVVPLVVVPVSAPALALQMLMPSPQDTGQRLVLASQGQAWPLGCSPVGS